MEIKIKTPVSEDAKEICSLLKGTFKNVNGKDYAKEQINAWIKFDSVEEICNRINDGNLRNFLAMDKEEIVGFMSLSTQSAYLNSLYVKSSKIGQGIGSELLKFAEMLLKCHGQRKVTVNSSKTARNFYEKKGYRTIANKNLSIEGTQIPVIQMTKNLE